MSSIKVISRDLLHCTKLLVMRCWYFSFTLGSVISDITVWSLTTILQLPGHSIIWLAPSSMILVVRYSVQQEVQYRWPHSRPSRLFLDVQSHQGNYRRDRIPLIMALGRDKQQISQSSVGFKVFFLTCSGFFLKGEMT